MKNTLGKQERLKSRKLIGKLFEEGESVKKFPFRMIYLKTNHTSKLFLQASFSVPKRNFKKAVDRNRIKRLTREAYRLEKNGLEQQLNSTYIIMITYIGKEEPIFFEAQQKIKELLSLFLKKHIQNEDSKS